MKTLGVYSSWRGQNEQIKLRNQMKRLLQRSYPVASTKTDPARAKFTVPRRDRPIAGEFWWDPERQARPADHSGTARFELRRGLLQRDHQPSGAARHEHPHRPSSDVPWASISTSGWSTAPSPLRAPLRLTWGQVYRQFGLDPDKASDKQTVKNFRRKVLRELQKIKLAWKDLNYSTAPGLLILHPSTPKIAPINQGQLISYPPLSRRGDRP